MLQALLDLCFPRNCAGCGVPDPDASSHLCWNCISDFSVIQPPFCEQCGNPVAGKVEHAYRCAHCAQMNPDFHIARSCVRYDGAVRDMILSLKYHSALWLVHDMLPLLEACCESFLAIHEIDLVMPIPLHPVKKRDRGYNQASVLGKPLAAKLGIPWEPRCLQRIRQTGTQTRLTARQRITNVKGAFKVRWPQWLEGKNILIIDDVMTTGATVSEAARELRKSGAGSVAVLTVARGQA